MDLHWTKLVQFLRACKGCDETFVRIWWMLLQCAYYGEYQANLDHGPLKVVELKFACLPRAMIIQKGRQMH